ncbi:type 11 methyltransferase [Trypanosoma theileri]|uniref:Type 11 methyltransferase n=1 Tax=Trypanosoma theileri TaxID=67003 RepID=A0A1X0NQR6_9TRYP|nr:type 11 methyltransferase [Trypanosoma theileri]ORC87056.1 type 11 methyltransferase [Trypanosoma theileri]
MPKLFHLLSIKNLRSTIYDWIVTSMTIVWYREVFLQCPVESTILDVGVGTGTSLIANRDIIQSKQLLVTGVDYDVDYVQRANANVSKYRLNNQVKIVHSSILDFKESPFDVIYFSGSFMIMPNKVDVLKHCCSLLRRSKTNGVSSGEEKENVAVFFFTQTFEKPTLLGLYITPILKRLMKIVTTIDFGEVTYEKDFLLTLKEAGVKVVSLRTLEESYFRKQVIVIARPED